jgi:hypothetical protein
VKYFLKDNELIFLKISEFYFSNDAKVDQVGISTFQVWTIKAAGGVKQPFNSFRFKTKTMICLLVVTSYSIRENDTA